MTTKESMSHLFVEGELEKISTPKKCLKWWKKIQNLYSQFVKPNNFCKTIGYPVLTGKKDVNAHNKTSTDLQNCTPVTLS